MNGDGYLDFEEFETFLNSLCYHKQSILQKAASRLRNVVGIQWCEEKRSKISDTFNLICKTNVVIGNDSLSVADFNMVLSQDMNLKKRSDLQQAIKDITEDAGTDIINKTMFRKIIKRIDHNCIKY